MSRIRQISQRGVPGIRSSAGVGYVAIAKDVDRDVFVENCFRTGTIAVQTNFGEFLNKVKISKSALKYVEFPADYKGLGSEVVWVNIPKHNVPIVVGVLLKDDEFLNVSENQFLLHKEKDGSVVEISGDARFGVICVNIKAEGDEGGSLDINVKNQASDARINVEVDGEMNLKAGDNINVVAGEGFNLSVKNLLDEQKETVIKYQRKDGFLYLDEFDNEITVKDGQLTVKTPKTNLGDGDYSVKDLLEDIIDEISNSTVQTGMGTQPLLNKVQIIALKQKVIKILN